MIEAIICDFSRVLLFPKDRTYSGSLNELHAQLATKPDYAFFDHFLLNHELLDWLQFISTETGVPLYIFTSETIQEAEALQSFLHPLFTEIFSASRLGIAKNSPDAYRTLANLLNKPTRSLLYLDDSTINITAATEAGCQAIHYQSNDLAMSALKAQLS